jgi:hypothetical protein
MSDELRNRSRATNTAVKRILANREDRAREANKERVKGRLQVEDEEAALREQERQEVARLAGPSTLETGNAFAPSGIYELCGMGPCPFSWLIDRYGNTQRRLGRLRWVDLTIGFIGIAHVVQVTIWVGRVKTIVWPRQSRKIGISSTVRPLFCPSSYLLTIQMTKWPRSQRESSCLGSSWSS